MERLGQKLKNRREELALTIKDIEAKTNIRAKYLEAIEIGNYDIVPGEVFLKGFIKNYSEAIGFNSADILKQYHAEKNNVVFMPETSSEAAEEIVMIRENDNQQLNKSKELEELINTLNNSIYVNEKEQPLAQENSVRPNSRIDTYDKISDKKPSRSIKNIVVALLVVCVGGLAGYIFWAESGVFADKNNKPVAEVPVVTTVPSSTPTTTTTKETKVMESKPVETPKAPEVPATPSKPSEPSKPEAKPSEPATAVKPETKVEDVKKTTNTTTANTKQPVRVVANVTEACWMNVIVDGKAVFTGTAGPGENKSWVANDQVTVHLGNAAGVNLTVNDQAIAKGKQGEVVTRTFNATK